MDIVKFTKKIHAIEVKHSLFNLKDTDGLLYWDIIRHDVFYAIYYDLADIKKVATISDSKIEKVINFIKCSYHAATLLFAINTKSYKYLCVSCARYKNPDNKNVDYALNDILKIVKSEAFVLETNIVYNTNYQYKSYLNAGLLFASYISKLRSLLKKKQIGKYEIAQILKKEFDLNIELDSIIDNLLNRYKIEYKYYLNLLNKLKPQKVFLVQNGIQKSFFKAANSIGINVYEMQHGLVSFIHPAYDYPAGLNLSFLKSFPSYFLSFSSFWSANIHYPVKQVITIGNNFFAGKSIIKNKEFDLTIILADIYTLDFIKLLDDFLKPNIKLKIAIKLHPNQLQDVEYITNHFLKYSCVEIIYNSRTIKELLLVTNSILTVQSTCVYEALDYHVKVLIYKIKDYKTHEDIFTNPNVYQIDDLSNIEKYLNKSYVDTNTVYFEKFNEEKMVTIINE